jgi:hypothetical protein
MKTPIEWLMEQLETYGEPSYCQIKWDELDLLINRAKEIEKQQIELAFLMGKHNGVQICQYNSKAKEIKAKQYYNETYKK